MSLPVVDLRPLRTGGASGAVAASIDAACRETGFFLVEGHGIPERVRADAFAAARRLFDLPAADKEAVSIARSACHRGYVGVGRETLETVEADAPADLKEAFDLSRDLGPGHPEVAAGTPLYGPNQWPPVPGFRAAVEAYYDAVFGAGLLVCRGMAMALGLPDDFFTRCMTDSVTNLRLLHYPPRHAARPEPGQPGCGAHTDYGMVTLLAVDGVAGLEVLHRDGRWVAATPGPHQLVVNIGDMMARWSNDRWVSTLHRVTTPEREHRYSIPCFVNPAYRTMVAPVTGAGETPRHEPVTAGDYLLSRFDSTHAYRAG